MIGGLISSFCVFDFVRVGWDFVNNLLYGLLIYNVFKGFYFGWDFQIGVLLVVFLLAKKVQEYTRKLKKLRI